MNELELVTTIEDIEHKLNRQHINKLDLLSKLRVLRLKVYQAESNYRTQLALRCNTVDNINYSYQCRLNNINKELDSIEELL